MIGGEMDDGTLIQHTTNSDAYRTAQSLRNQMESLRIGGQIPANAMGKAFYIF